MLRWFFSLLLALGPLVAHAQDWATPEVCGGTPGPVDDSVFEPIGRATLEDAAARIENRRGKFWRIEHLNGAVSHLWGTWHSSDPLILDLPEDVTRTIDTSRLVAVEVDFVHKTRQAYRDAQDDPNRFRAPSDPFAFDGTGDGTIAGLSPKLSDWVRVRAIEMGWTEDAEMILSTAGLAEMLLADPCEDFTAGILPIQDDYIQLRGRLAGARILGLEEPGEFLADLTNDKTGTAEAIIAVYAAYQMPVSTNTPRSAAFQLYREGRLGLLAAWDAAYLTDVLGNLGPKALEHTDAYLLAFRNVRFVNRLERQLSQGGVFVAVGAGHLPGPDGLVALLRDDGYTVTRIVLPGEAE
ncbi:MAG: TraB/GumN family protein [Paracoccaceae bacterium]|nr:TraB/GumN family protein [Paracoccaceae bacterium]